MRMIPDLLIIPRRYLNWGNKSAVNDRGSALPSLLFCFPAFEAPLRAFLPFSIVPGTASPGKASSNGEDYSATITEPEWPLGPALRAPLIPHLPRAERLLRNLQGGLPPAPVVHPCFASPPPRTVARHSPVPEISGFQIRNANYVLSRRGWSIKYRSNCVYSD